VSVGVVRIIARLNVGGPARHAVLLDTGLRARGFQTLLVHGSVSDEEASFEQLAERSGIPTSRVPALGRRIHLLDDARAFLGVWRAIRHARPDVVHTHTAKAGALGRIAATIHNLTRPRRTRCAIVHTFHGHVLEGYFGAVGNVLARLIERGLGGLTDCTIAISELQRRDLVDRFRVAARARTVVVPLGLDLGALAAVSRRGHEGFVVGFVGRLVPIKNVGALLHAIAIASREIPDLRLTIYGDGPQRVPLEAMARALSIDDRVTFAGWHNELPDLYAGLDVVALTSLNEGTPVAVIEAMAAGVPVVASAVGGVPDVVDHGVTGLLTTTSAEDIAAALVQVHRDPESTSARAARARAIVSERYGTERLVSRIADLYVETVGRKRGITASKAE